MDLKFSVLMSIYNKETSSNLEQCLNSLLTQTILPTEIVVVLDGNIRDELLLILKKYKVRIIKLKHHVGLAQALKIGVSKCKYDLIARMDTDDIALPNRFKLQIKQFQEDDTLALVGGQIVEFDKKGLKNKRIVPTDYKDICIYSKTRNPFNHMTVMFKKNIIINVGNYEDIKGFEDYYLWIKILRSNYKVKNLNDILVKVRIDDNHKKRRGSLKYISYTYKFEKKLYKQKYINLLQFITNLLIRFSISIIPNKLRVKFYDNILRKWGV